MIISDNNISLPESSQGYNRYSYVLNNPLKYTDPSGEFVFEALAVGTMINGLFFTEPGYTFQKYLSPVAIKFNIGYGSDGLNIGYDFSYGMPTIIPFIPARRWNIGHTYFSNFMGTGKYGVEKREGAELTVNYIIGQETFRGTKYTYSGQKGIELLNQTTNTTSYSIPLIFVGVDLENDMDQSWSSNLMGYSHDFIPKADGGDRYGHGATYKLNVGLWEVGLEFMTGEPELEDGRRPVVEYNGQEWYVGEDKKYRRGLLYMQFGPFSIGWNYEGIRHTIQNRWIYTENNLPYFPYVQGDTQEWWEYFYNPLGFNWLQFGRR